MFSACDFIAEITQHIPDKRFQMVRCYGWYSNKMPGQRRKRAEADAVHKSAATAEQGRLAKVSTVIEIIELHAPRSRRMPSQSWRELIKHDPTSLEVRSLLCNMRVHSLHLREAECLGAVSN